MGVEYGNYQYKYFKATVPEQNISVGTRGSDQRWRYFDYGPKSVTPLICLGGVAATADVFYKQILALSSKGYRVISVDAPPLWMHEKWLAAFDQFLDALKVHQIHIYGTSLGGFLAQLYAQHRPRKVLSLVLSNTFLNTHMFNAAFSPWSAMFPWTPDFVLKRLILSGLQDGPHEALIADSIDFVVLRMEKLGRAELASRLVLNTQEASVGHLPLADSKITLMDSLDHGAVLPVLREALYTRHPNARKAFLKSGGDFPFLSRADEVNLHLLLHLRSVAAERSGPEIDTVPVSGEGRWADMRKRLRLKRADDEEEEEEEDGGADRQIARLSDPQTLAGTPRSQSSPLLNSGLSEVGYGPGVEGQLGGSETEVMSTSTASLLQFWGEMEKKTVANEGKAVTRTGSYSFRNLEPEKRDVKAPKVKDMSRDSDVSFREWAAGEHPLSDVVPAPASSRPSFGDWPFESAEEDPLGVLAKTRPHGEKCIEEEEDEEEEHLLAEGGQDEEEGRKSKVRQAEGRNTDVEVNSGDGEGAEIQKLDKEHNEVPQSSLQDGNLDDAGGPREDSVGLEGPLPAIPFSAHLFDHIDDDGDSVDKEVVSGGPKRSEGLQRFVALAEYDDEDVAVSFDNEVNLIADADGSPDAREWLARIEEGESDSDKDVEAVLPSRAGEREKVDFPPAVQNENVYSTPNQDNERHETDHATEQLKETFL